MESALLSRSSRIAADPLSSVLSFLRPRGFMSGGVDAGGDWAFSFEADRGFRCFGLVSGQCLLSLEGERNPVQLEAGDFVVLPHGRAFRLASDLHVPPVDIQSVITAPLNGNILSWQGGGACLTLSAFFLFDSEHAGLLSGVLPPVVHIRHPADRAAMHWYLERMMSLLREPQPGTVLLSDHLAQMMLIEILRLHVADSAAGVGWLSALADRQLRSAIAAIHERPGHRWTVQGLAEQAVMSRSAFALRFKEKVGSSAMEYLTRWRMLLAGDRLVNSDDSVSEIAFSLGYESESAFSFAFKREMGCSPRQFARPEPASRLAPAGP